MTRSPAASRVPLRSFRDQIAAYFKARPGVWINALDLERVGGRQAWRTRVSDCRVALGMTIQNRTRRIVRENGEPLTISEYRYVASLVDMAS